MQFLNFDYSKNYYNSYKDYNKDYGVGGKHFALTTVSPTLNSFLTKNNKKNKIVIDFNSQYFKTIISLLSVEEDYFQLKTFLHHGNYFEKFFKQYLRKKYYGKIVEIKVEIKNYLIDYYKSKNLTVYDSFFIDYIIDDILEFYLYNKINKNDVKLIENKIKEFTFNDQSCEICGKRYNVIFLPNWLYFNTNGNSNICYECPVQRTTKVEITNSINKLIRLVNFIPNSNFYKLENNSFSSRVSHEIWKDAFDCILKFGATHRAPDVMKLKFGSWFEALVESGVLEKNQLMTHRGIKCISKSGNICNSLDEQFIDNKFYQNNLKYSKEPKYPKHEKYNPKGLMRADWEINGVYVEYFGLKGEKKYDEKTENKIMLSKELGIKLISIFPEDLLKIDEIIIEIISASAS
jgi:hypothetical protein